MTPDSKRTRNGYYNVCNAFQAYIIDLNYITGSVMNSTRTENGSLVGYWLLHQLLE
jgi:hypothetical protein